MDKKRVAVVTDGGVVLSADAVSKQRIVVLPRRVHIGKQVLTSDRRTTLETINERAANFRGPVNLLPLQLGQFVSAYRKLHSHQRRIISIHAPQSVDNACHQALLARNMLKPEVEVEIFEALTLDAGISLLVEAAAQLARRGDVTVEQVQALLHRLQAKIHTLLITTNPDQLAIYPPLSSSQRLKARIPGIETLLSLDKTTGSFRLEDQSFGLTKQIVAHRQLFAQVEDQCNVWVKCRRSRQDLKLLQSQLASMLRIESFHLQRAGVEAAFLRGDFIEIILLPAESEVNRIAGWVRKWGK